VAQRKLHLVRILSCGGRSEAGLAMTLARTSLVTDQGAVPLSSASLDLVVT
jgi:hypothetical protein